MTAVDTDGSLYDAQEAAGLPSGNMFHQDRTEGTTFFVGPLSFVYSEVLSAGVGGTGDTLSLMKLPNGTVILDGWVFVEDGLQAANKLSNLGIIYEDGDGTDNDEALIQNMDLSDGATGTIADLDALPAGALWILPQDCTNLPYKVTGGVGTVTLTTEDSAFIASKDFKICLMVIMPGV